MARVLVNGVHLNVSVGGAGAPLLLLHGFTGGIGTWRPHVVALRRRYTTVAVDLLGHGRSDAPAEPAHYGVDCAAVDLAALLDRLGLAPAHVVGYSMGGRIALRLALDHPGVVRRLVLEGVSAGIQDEAERGARAARDEAIARRIETDGVAAFVDYWESQPLFASQNRLPAAVRQAIRAERLRNRAIGLASSLRGGGVGAQEPLHGRLTGLEAVTLLVVGELDAAALERAEEVARLAPHARLALIPGAGHAPHIERPAEFRRAIIDFLSMKEPAHGD